MKLVFENDSTKWFVDDKGYIWYSWRGQMLEQDGWHDDNGFGNVFTPMTTKNMPEYMKRAFNFQEQHPVDLY